MTWTREEPGRWVSGEFTVSLQTGHGRWLRGWNLWHRWGYHPEPIGVYKTLREAKAAAEALR